MYTNSWIPFYDSQRKNVLHAKKTVVEGGRRFSGGLIGACKGFYQERIMPAWIQADAFLEQHIPTWRDLIYKLQISTSRAILYLDIQAKNVRLAFFRFQNILQLSFLSYVSSVESLRPLATKPLADAFAWTLISITAIPVIMYTLSSFIRLLVYLLRPGSASVVIMNESVIVQSIETSFKYNFKNKDLLLQALEVSDVLQKLGPSVLALVAAETGMGPMSSEFQVKIDTIVDASPIFDIVRPGPGRNSRMIVAKKRRDLFVTTLAAVYKDSDMSIKNVMRIIGNSSGPADGQDNGAEALDQDHHDDTNVEKRVDSDGSDDTQDKKETDMEGVESKSDAE